MSKFNSETSFLYQLFKENSNTAWNVRTQSLIQTHSMAAVNCTRRRRLIAIAKCIAWHVHSGEPNMPNRERCGCATTKTTFKNITIIPSNQHFKAFPMSKFNSETSFLYQLFKGNSNFILLKPYKVIDLSIFMIFIIIYI